MSHNTGNDLESSDILDFEDNCENLDVLMNADQEYWTDRLGNKRPTIDYALRMAGFTPAGFDFTTGGVLKNGDRNKCVFNQADQTWYSWTGDLPYNVIAGSVPGEGWKVVNRNALTIAREALRRTYLEVGLNLVEGSFEQGAVITSSTDVVLHEKTGKCYSGPIGNVNPGTSPIGPDFADRAGAVFSTYRTVADMVEGLNITNGSYIRTTKHVINVVSEWEIVSIPPETYYVALNNGLFAKLISSDGNILHYGAAPYPTDSRPAIQAAVNHVNGYFAPKGIWACLGSVPLKRGSWVKGVGCLQGIGSDIAAKLPVGSDLHPYIDVGGYPQGGVTIENILFTNDIADDYFSFPNPANVIASQNRAFWAVEDQPFVDTSTWVYKKTGGGNCPHLKISNVNCRNFLIGVDVHTWMSKIEGLQGRYCGVTARVYGTSTSIKQLWPQYPLLAGAQLRLEYSSLESSSAGEHPVAGYTPTVYGIELHGGNMTLSDVGMELACKAQFLIYNGKYRIENPWSSIVTGFKPKYIYDIVAYPDLTLSDFFDYRYYQTALMRTNRRDNVDGIKLATPIYPWFQSSINTQFNVWTKVTEDGGEKFIGIFGNSLVLQNGVYLLPFCRNNYTTNAGSNEDSAKAEYMAVLDSILIGSALYQHRVVVDVSGYQIGDSTSGECLVIPMVAADSDGTVAKYPSALNGLSISWSATKTATGFDTFVTATPAGVTAVCAVSGASGQENVQFRISVGAETMSVQQKNISKCRFVDKVRTTGPGNTTANYIVQIARS